MTCTTRALWMLALLLAGACGDPPPQPEPKRRKETLADLTFRLPNGLEVELLTGRCGETAGLALLLEIGADHDPPGRSGMAHLLARVWSQAGEHTVTSGRDHTLLSATVAIDALPSELDELAARMARLEVSEEELERARAEVLADIAGRRGGDPARMATSYAAESIQPSRGDGWRGGVTAEVEAIELAEVVARWSASYAAHDARLVVVGDFDRDAIRARIERAFGRVPAGEAPTEREPTDATVTGTLVMGDAPSAVAVAVPAPAPSDPGYPAFLVLAARLAREPAEPRSWSVEYDPLHLPETLFVTGPREPAEQAETSAASLRRELSAAIAGPITPADLAAARERFGLVLGLHDVDPLRCRDDAESLAVAHARRAQLGLDELDLEETLAATTDEQLDEAAERFTPRRSAAVVAGGTIR